MSPFSFVQSPSRGFFKVAPGEPPNYEEDDPLQPNASDNFPLTPQKIPKALYWLVAALILTIWLLLFVILSQGSWASSFHTSSHWTKDIIPKGDPFVYEFKETYNYSTFNPAAISELYSKYWVEDMYAVPVKDASKYGLLPGYPTLRDEHVEGYMPAFLHQFHCLILFRTNWWEMRRRIGKDPYNTPPLAVEEDEEERLSHVEHCLDYMRQTVACWADTTLEGPALHEDKERTNTDGMNYPHECYDMDTVFKKFREMAVMTRFVRPGDPLIS